MGKGINRLSARAVETKSEPGYYADGAGLYLQVSVGKADGNEPLAKRRIQRSWIYRFSLNKRAREMGLGPTHTIGLAEARAMAAECRKLLIEGIDPIEERDRRKAQLRVEAATAMTFDACAEAYIAAHRGGWRNAKHADQWTNTLTTYASPVIGSIAVRDIELPHILRVLEPIWSTKTETATRLRGRIESVLDWATVRNYRQGANPARWRGHLDKLLPKPSKVSKVVHHTALPAHAMENFMDELRKQNGAGARALEFAILTAARSGEVRGALWSEIDLDTAIWTVPGERMKAGKEHRVPLSRAVIALLKALPRFDDEPTVFPSPTGGALSDMTLTAVIRRMKVDAVPHGFRSTFRDWCSEHTDHPREVAEMALAHAISDKVEAAYRRGDLFNRRRSLMEQWAEFCAGAHQRQSSHAEN